MAEKKIVVASGKGGVGKSMLTSSLATLFARNKRVVAVDCDVDTPNLAIWLGENAGWDRSIPVVASARPKIDYNKCNNCGICINTCQFGALEKGDRGPRLNPFLCEGCGACEAVCPQGAIQLESVENGEIKIKTTKHGFPLIAGQLYPGERGSGKIVDEVKAEAEKIAKKEKEDGVQMLRIVDSAPGTGCPVIASLRDADLAVLVIEPSLSGFHDLKKTLKVVEHFAIPWTLALNKWDIDQKMSEDIQKWAGDKFLGKISYDKEILKAISYLIPIMDTDFKAKGEIENIFKKVQKYPV